VGKLSGTIIEGSQSYYQTSGFARLGEKSLFTWWCALVKLRKAVELQSQFLKKICQKFDNERFLPNNAPLKAYMQKAMDGFLNNPLID
jgi:hypothetical protein